MDNTISQKLQKSNMIQQNNDQQNSIHINPTAVSVPSFVEIITQCNLPLEKLLVVS